jgi:hypothetical protein
MACIQSDYVIQIILSSKSYQDRLTDSKALGWIESTDQPRARQNIIKYTMGPSLESIGHGQSDETDALALIGTGIFLCVPIINMTLLLPK